MHGDGPVKVAAEQSVSASPSVLRRMADAAQDGKMNQSASRESSGESIASM